LSASGLHLLFGAHLITGTEYSHCHRLSCVAAGSEHIRRGVDLEKRRDRHSTAGMGVSGGPRVPVPVCGSTKGRGFHRFLSVLEGNVVSYCGSGLRTRLSAWHLSAAFLPVVPRAEQDNVPGDNLCPVFPLATLLVFPTRCLQLAFDVELRNLCARIRPQSLPDAARRQRCAILSCLATHSFLSLNRSLVARLSLATGTPPAVYLTSGS